MCYHIKSLQCAQNVGCLKNFGTNLWSLTSNTFFSLMAPLLLNPLTVACSLLELIINLAGSSYKIKYTQHAASYLAN